MASKDEGPSGVNYKLFFHIESNNISEVINILETEDADVNARAKYVSPVAYSAIMVGGGYLVKDFPCKTKNGDTPLMFAVSYGLIDIVKLLIEKGADVNARKPDTDSGKTALMIAQEECHTRIIDILRASGAESG